MDKGGQLVRTQTDSEIQINRRLARGYRYAPDPIQYAEPLGNPIQI